jgi:hypothetical protein
MLLLLEDTDTELLMEAVRIAIETKEKALETSKLYPALEFTPNDFGIPKLTALLDRITTEYNKG